MNEVSNIEQNTGLAQKTTVSFVTRNIPFIWYKRPSKLPFIGHNQPLGRFRSKLRGFTLIELMITILVAGILLGIGIPNFQSFIKNNRIVSQTNDLLADLVSARSEALKRSRNVHICKTSDPTLASPVCNVNNADPWTSGWITWIDKNSSGSLNSPEEILRVSEGMAGSLNTLTTANANIQNEIVFVKLGLLSNSGGTLHLCDDRGSSFGRTMTVTTSGRPRIGRDPTC